MVEGYNSDIWIESDGRKIMMLEYTGTGTDVITVTKLAKIERAMVSCQSVSGIRAHIASGGISGNNIALIFVSCSGSRTSGGEVSGNLFTVLVAGQ